MSKKPAKPAKTSKTKDTKAPEVTPEMLAHIERVRAAMQTAFGQVSMSMMLLPRYKHVPMGDMQSLILEPLLRDRVAIAQLPADAQPEGQTGGPVGAMIWAKVSDAVHAKITEQIKAGVFPLRLEPGDWDSGEQVWILDVIAPTQDLTRRVLANAGQLVKEGGVNIHPIVTRLVGRALMEEMGAKAAAGSEGA